ncbi:MAG: hypothetical protein HYX55_01205 [Chloroflexi bacterium]|nr:hypothetical protein [Chloroflexota bacterium]
MGLTLLTLLVVTADRAPGTEALIELRGWPHYFAFGLQLAEGDSGLSVWFEEKALPSLLEDALPIGHLSLLWFLVDWGVFTGAVLTVVGTASKVRGLSMLGLSAKPR